MFTAPLAAAPQQKERRFEEGGSRQSATADGHLTVEAVVQPVDDVLGLGLEHDESRLVLLDHRLLGLGERLNAVHITHTLERRPGVGSYLARGSRVHALDAEVRPDVGVVQVDLVATAEVLDALVVTVGEGGGSGAEGSGASSGLRQELAASLEEQRRRRESVRSQR